MRDNMNCKEAQRCIRKFWNNELDADTVREFVMHVHSCKECMEEVTIEYLISEGICKDEDINIQEELEYRLERANKVKTRWSQLEAGLFVVATTVACILFMI